MKRTEKINELTNLLYSEYRTVILSKKQVAQILNVSQPTLDRMRKYGAGPKWKKKNEIVTNSSVEFLLNDVVEYVVDMA